MIEISKNDAMLSTPSTYKEVEKVTKDNVQQAQKINAASEHLVASQLKNKENSFIIPFLRAPIEQKKNNQKINIKEDVKYSINVFSTKSESDNSKLIFNKNNKMNEDKLNKSLSSISSAPTQPEDKKSNKDYDFLFLQLSYQNIIHKNVLDRIKDPDKLDYYLDKLNILSKGIDGLRDQFESILDEIKKTKMLMLIIGWKLIIR